MFLNLDYLERLKVYQDVPNKKILKNKNSK